MPGFTKNPTLNFDSIIKLLNPVVAVSALVDSYSSPKLIEVFGNLRKNLNTDTLIKLDEAWEISKEMKCNTEKKL